MRAFAWVMRVYEERLEALAVGDDAARELRDLDARIERRLAREQDALPPNPLAYDGLAISEDRESLLRLFESYEVSRQRLLEAAMRLEQIRTRRRLRSQGAAELAEAYRRLDGELDGI